DHPELGSICSGGRYDDLAGQYTTTRLPGVGISIGFTRLFWQLREAGLLPEGSPAVPVSVALMSDDDLEYSLGVAARLRAAGIDTETQMTPSRLGKQLKAADRRGCVLVVIAGESERQRSTVSVRDLTRGEQVEVPRSDLGDHGTRRLSQEPGTPMRRYRHHFTTELGPDLVGQRVRVAGWVARRRDHGGIAFLDIRDGKGIVQVVVDPARLPQVDDLRMEYTVTIEGEVTARPEGTINPDLVTGE